MKLPKALALTAVGVAVVGIVYVQPVPTSAAPTSGKAALLATHPGKGLAANCMQCHGTNGRGGPFESIAGKDPTSLYNDLKEEQSHSEGTGIMRVHANAYSDAELRLIADFFARS
jgi:sulfide dehydrogenase cytochrome subunit